jgi:hypothetical protein
MIFITAVLQMACKAGNSASESPQVVPRQAVRNSAPSSRLFCPHTGAGLAVVEPSIGGHKVILSWKPSRPADSKHAAAVGYCVYRGPNAKFAPTELLNPLPLPGTTCVDDSVENGKRYYYEVLAISAKGVASKPTKPPILAKIPPASHRASEAIEDSIPPCRESPGVQ